MLIPTTNQEIPMERRDFLKSIFGAVAVVATGSIITPHVAEAAVLPVPDKQPLPLEAPKVETKFRPAVDSVTTEQAQFRRGRGIRRARRQARRQRRFNRRMNRRGFF
jgi:hypothetical protein